MMSSRKWVLPLTVFVVGVASLGSEIAFVRLISPWFGSSTLVWSITLGVVLASLSAGYLLGGRAAGSDQAKLELLLPKILVFAGLYLAFIAVAGPASFGWLTERLQKLPVGAWSISIASCTLLVVPAFVAIGAVTPLVIQLWKQIVGGGSGRITGNVYALSTLANLVGIYLAALVLIPSIQTTRTVAFFGFLLTLMALVQVGPRFIVPAAIAALAVLAGPENIKQWPGYKLIASEESKLQFAHIWQGPNGDRLLEMASHGVTHSTYDPTGAIHDDYWDYGTIAPLINPSFQATGGPKNVLMLGNSGGTIARNYRRYFPEVKFDGVEIDQKVTDLARRYFDMNGSKLTVHTADARPFLKGAKQRWDVIYIDTFRSPYIPFYLTTKEFFALVAQRLNPGGVVVMNVQRTADDVRLMNGISGGAGDSFKTVLQVPVTYGNTLFCAFAGQVTANQAVTALQKSDVPEPFRQLAVKMASVIRPANVDTAKAFSDDLAPIESIINAKSFAE